VIGKHDDGVCDNSDSHTIIIMGDLGKSKGLVAQASTLMKVAMTGSDLDEVIRQADRMLQELRTGELYVCRFPSCA
jgi:hypothetical protein